MRRMRCAICNQHDSIVLLVMNACVDKATRRVGDKRKAAESTAAKESDCESSVGSPEPASLAIDADTGTDLTVGSKQIHSRLEETNSSEPKMPPNMTVTSHLNGAMAGLVTLQNLQNLASLQQSLPQVASLAAGLSNMANLSGNSVVNAPLNLSVSASADDDDEPSEDDDGDFFRGANGSSSSRDTATHNSSPNSTAMFSTSTMPHPAPATPRSTQSIGVTESPPSIMTTSMNSQQPPATPMQAPNPLIGSQQPAPMPQFILASGHLVQGIQGAQLLIPTSQGKYFKFKIYNFNILRNQCENTIILYFVL
ncbi:hypothetical protein NQ314_006491 [Rhamnusium bicolor]|uniref:Uncharacterized protein n=1 Tax=Rhamnusium bicolor TaxID=1586634 RepID=A0AAV8Z3S8_9CUCU|nr:hypothetical protein NQ314_006491 [Rhamnusium bicolor]